MIRPNNRTEDLIISIPKNCETFIKQTHRRAEETLEFKLSQPRKIFHFTPPILVEVSWMIGLTILEVYNSIFIIITEETIKFVLYKDNFDEFSSEELKDELEEYYTISFTT